jgi:hypothetical protein
MANSNKKAQNRDLKSKSRRLVLLLLTIVSCLNGAAQNDSRALLKQVIQENQEAVNAIAMYPSDTRRIIFEATEYPEIIAKLNSMQKNSETAFEKLISAFSKEDQEKIWNLTRYDGLIADLAADHKKSEAEINDILSKYPQEIHETALEEGKNNYGLLVQIDKMNRSYDSDFEFLLNGYPTEAVNAFREMIKMPEVLSLLFDHMQYTVVVGDYYRKDPERIMHKTDSLNLVLNQKNTKEADDWKQSMKDNPQAQQEYTQAAEEYAQDNGYQPDVYNSPLTEDVTNYSTNPYNWWFGYPSWYPDNYWNPYPYWYDWGFYYGPRRQVVFFGLPSSYFMEWFFYSPEHFSRYAELSNHYYNYYDRHRESMNYNSISHGVNEWREKNREIVNDSWDNDNTNRAQRFKQFGQLETDRNKFNSKNPKSRLEQTEYLQRKQNKYPLLNVDASRRQSIKINSRTENTNLVRKPTVSVPGNFKVNEQENQRQNGNVTIQKQPVYVNPHPNNNDAGVKRENVVIQQKPVNNTRQTQNSNVVRNAQQYHQNTWNQIQPTRQSPVSQPRQQENRRVEQPVRQNNQAPSNNRRK